MNKFNVKNKIGNIRIEECCGALTYTLVRLKQLDFLDKYS